MVGQKQADDFICLRIMKSRVQLGFVWRADVRFCSFIISRKGDTGTTNPYIWYPMQSEKKELLEFVRELVHSAADVSELFHDFDCFFHAVGPIDPLNTATRARSALVRMYFLIISTVS
jgi:hypothetical protein